MFKNVLLLALSLLSPHTFSEQGRLTQVWELSNVLSNPESVIFDPQTNLLYASSVNGGTAEKDGNGFLSAIALDGKLVNQSWLSGLNAPKGLAVIDGTLYVADIDELVEIDIGTASISNRYPAAGATFLNDVAADSRGRVYVSDSRSSLIYRLTGNQLDIWIKDESIRNPNGIFAEEQFLVVAAGDNNSENPAGARYLMTIDYESKAINPLTNRTAIGGIDAVEPDHQGGYLLSDWAGGTVMHYSREGHITELLKRERGTADFTYLPASQMLYLPLMMESKLIAYKLD